MDPEERARRREERRRKKEEESDAAETNGPTEETEEEQERRERRERRTRERAGLSNDTGEDDSERLRQEEQEQRQREGEETRRREEEEAEQQREAEEKEQQEEEARRKREEKERKRNAEIERQRQEDLKKQETDGDAKPKKKLSLLGRVSKGRKKEILAMMLKKARGDLQVEEQEAAAEKARYIESKVKDTNVDSFKKDQLMKLCEELFMQLQKAEGEKFDMEIKVKRRDLQISNLKVKANETRGRFAMPTLKTVSKTSSKSKDTERKDFRSDLKKPESTDEN